MESPPLNTVSPRAPAGHPGLASADIAEPDAQPVQDAASPRAAAVNGLGLDSHGHKRKPGEQESESEPDAAAHTDSSSAADGVGSAPSYLGPGPVFVPRPRTNLTEDDIAQYALLEELRKSIARGIHAVKRPKPNSADRPAGVTVPENLSARERLDRVRKLHAAGSAVSVEESRSTKASTLFAAPRADPGHMDRHQRRYRGSDYRGYESYRQYREHSNHLLQRQSNYEQLRLYRRRQAQQNDHRGEPRSPTRLGLRAPTAEGGLPENREARAQAQQQPLPSAGPSSSQPIALQQPFGTPSGFCVHPSQPHASAQVAHSFLALLHPVHVPQPPVAVTPSVQSSAPIFQHPHAQLFAPQQRQPSSAAPVSGPSRAPYPGPQAAPHLAPHHHHPQQGHFTRSGANNGRAPQPRGLVYYYEDHFTNPLPPPRPISFGRAAPAPSYPMHRSSPPQAMQSLEESMFLEAQTRSLQQMDNTDAALCPSDTAFPIWPTKRSPEGFTRSLRTVGRSANSVVCVGCDAPLMGTGVSWFVRGCGHLYCKECSEHTSECGFTECDSFRIAKADCKAQASLGQFREVFF